MTGSEVIDAVEDHLERPHYRIKTRVPTVEAYGNDLVAVSPKGVTLHIEAKGQTSQQSASPRFGKEFTPDQKESHFGRAPVRPTRHVSEGRKFGIDLPGEAVNATLARTRSAALDRLGVLVFLVSALTREVGLLVGS